MGEDVFRVGVCLFFWDFGGLGVCDVMGWLGLEFLFFSFVVLFGFLL